MGDKRTVQKRLEYTDVRMKKKDVNPFVTGCIGGAAGVLLVGMAHIVAGAFGVNRIFGLSVTSGSLWRYWIDIVLSAVSAFAVSWLLYKDRKASGPLSGGANEEERNLGPAETVEKVLEERALVNEIYSPLQGKVLPLAKVPDHTFAAKVLGDGAAVLPAEGKAYAPFDGRVEMLYGTKHAIRLMSETGARLLIHIGINTVELEGEYFESFVRDGERIRQGELLLSFDIDKIREAGYQVITPVVLTNSDDFDTIQITNKKDVSMQDILMKI